MIIVKSEQQILVPKADTYYYTEVWNDKDRHTRIPCIAIRLSEKKSVDLFDFDGNSINNEIIKILGSENIHSDSYDIINEREFRMLVELKK